MFSISPSGDAGLNYYTCVTLIDITKTNVVHHYSKGISESEADYNIKRNQHRNYQTMLQVIGLRCQPMFLSDPVMYPDEDLTDFEQAFGSNYITGNVWAFNFGVEQEDIFLSSKGPAGLLIDDLHNVPIVTGLLENVDIDIAIIDTIGSVFRNTLILK